jgi:hypothetical protein
MTDRKRWAVACMAGSFKGSFVHGVLHGLEAAGFRADAYAAASSSTLVAAFAAAGQVRQIDLGIWSDGQQITDQPGTSMSDAVLATLRTCAPRLRDLLFHPQAAQFCVAVSHVRTAEAACITQGDGARRLGRRLMIEAARHDTRWRDQHLELRLFDTRSADPALRLTPGNLEEVAYASTRMMHAWHLPAFINSEPYVDASYTCQCPAVEMAGRGFDAVLAIATEPAPVARDLFGTALLPEEWKGTPIWAVCPARNLKDIGVDFQHATVEGLNQAFTEGIAAAQSTLAGQYWTA